MQIGGPLALVLSTLVLLPLSSLPQDDSMSWGWRVPFLLSSLLVVVGYVLRRTVDKLPQEH